MMPRWRCTHCHRSWASRSAATAHAGRCWYDPANRSCKTCVYFTPYRIERADGCAVEVPFPVIERSGRPVETLAVHCDSHRVSDAYVNPDVLDTLDAAAEAAH